MRSGRAWMPAVAAAGIVAALAALPEALHLVVNATHFGPGNGATRGYSKKAFQLLHQRYPARKWAAATKYWY